MSQITHEEARRLINFNADQSLDANTGSILDAHLNGCTECRKYASELDELENLLRKMKHSLDLRPAPLHLDQIMHRSKGISFRFLNNTMVTRITTIVAAFIAVAIVTWQFLSSQHRITYNTLYGNPHSNSVHIFHYVHQYEYHAPKLQLCALSGSSRRHIGQYCPAIFRLQGNDHGFQRNERGEYQTSHANKNSHLQSHSQP